jgi:hypothetical protein
MENDFLMESCGEDMSRQGGVDVGRRRRRRRRGTCSDSSMTTASDETSLPQCQCRIAGSGENKGIVTYRLYPLLN